MHRKPTQHLEKTCHTASSKFKHLIILLVVGIAALPLCEAQDAYPENETGQLLYVDSVNGNDAADGKTEATAVKTLLRAQRLMDEVPAETWVTLMMARGSVWRETYSPKSFAPQIRRELMGFPSLTQEMESDDSLGEKRGSPYLFGRDRLNLVAYGSGDKPTINGTDILENAKFQRHNPEKYPNVWSQKVTPPVSYFIPYHEDITFRTGVILDQKTPLWRFYTPFETKTRDYPVKQQGVETEEDALALVNQHANSFYVRNNHDGSFDYFINSGDDPTKDGRLYEYKVRGTFVTPKRGVRWEGIRIYGINHRDGVAGKPKSLKDVDFLFGDTHNMLIGEGHFKNVTSVGYRPMAPEGHAVPESQTNGNTSSVFHTYNPQSFGVVYDGCTGKDASTAFFDHHPEANREAVILRNCVTENVLNILSHGGSTKRSYIIGHRHSGTNGSAIGNLGGLAAEENFIEDSIFRLRSRGAWHADTRTLKIRNSVIYMPAGQRPLFLWGRENIEYENVTLILDYQGVDAKADPILVEYAGKEESNPATVTFKNCVIAVINAPNVSQFQGGETLKTVFGPLPKAKIENSVLTYMTGIPAEAGMEGADFEFATQDQIFSGNPTEGDYTINPAGPAGKRDAGYKIGRTPVFGPKADAEAASFVFYEKQPASLQAEGSGSQQ